MSITRFTFCILLAMFVFVVGCATWTSDPLVGWKCTGFESPNKAITADYQSFIQTLPPNQRGYNVGPIQFFEDGTGQHAVMFEDFVSGNSSWHYALIYDKENKRVKVIRYGHSRYMS